ncbi:MAG TPA: polysaccharide deacetylase family protein [Pseudoduganella sp.]|jgi:peptidoglycan/xylan/chitin deacetylase (PgdA/CDA1 family)
MKTLAALVCTIAGALAGALPLHAAPAKERFDVAVTVDDLPAHGNLPAGMTRLGIAEAHLQAFRAHGVPEAFGFVNAARLAQEPDSAAVLDLWRGAGQPLGNHAYSHMNLNSAPSLAAWQADVAAGEPAVAAHMAGADWHWFRYPNLAGGSDEATRSGALAWLRQRGYRIADVAMSFSDWDYTDAYARCVARRDDAAIAGMKAHYMARVDREILRTREQSKRVFGRVIPMVLLTHVGGWSSVTLPDVLRRLDAAGAHYVTLAQASADPAYATPGGGTVIERVARQRGIALDDAEAMFPDQAPPLDLKTVCR